MTAMSRVFQFHAQALWLPATSMEGVHGNETISDCRSRNAISIDYMFMAWTCNVAEWHALPLGESLFGYFRDQSRL